MEKKHPGITLDFTLMDELNKHPNYWFIEILCNQDLKYQFYMQITDPDDMNQIYGLLKDHFLKYGEIEGV